MSNILPKETSQICKSYLSGDVKTSLFLQLKYLDLINALFAEVNPIPVKAATAKMGYGENALRLPLTQIEDAHADTLFALMRAAGIEI